MSDRRKLQEIEHPLDYSLWVTLLLFGCVAVVAAPDYFVAGAKSLTNSATNLPGKAVEGLRSKLPSWVPGSTQTTAKNPRLRAALDTIAWAEGTYSKPNSGYNTLMGGSQIADLSKHPNICVPFGDKGQCSTAFGRYQALNKTWWRVKGNAPLTPKNQDDFALELLRACGVVDDILAGNPKWIRSGCVGGNWASFPKNGYGQPQHSAAVLTGQWQQFGGR